MDKYILAHDLGTSGNKATLYSIEGKLKASVLYEYDTHYPSQGHVEQNPHDWWCAVCKSTSELFEKSNIKNTQVEVVSFSAQMMGALAVDKQGEPLRNMIIWADTRAKKQEERMKNVLGMEYVYQMTGHRASASYSAAKLLWIKDNEPYIYKHTYKMLHAKDYIIHKLTGVFATDYSDASGTNLFDIRGKKWSKEILEGLQIEEGILPELYKSTDIIGMVTKEAASLTGLIEGTPVVMGGGDGSCACVGAGITKEGRAYNVLGSSSWTSLASKEPIFDEQMRTFNWVHLDSELYTPCGTMQAAGYSYSWYKNILCKEESQNGTELGISPYELINEGIKESKPGSGGIIYLPYLLGERSPRWNMDAKGAFIGLSVTTTKNDMARAVLEGVGYNLKLIMDILEMKNQIKEVALIGGGAKGDIWVQILADIWQKPIKIPTYLEEATSMGAAICGGVGVGIYPDFHVIEQFNKTNQVIMPNPDLKYRYGKMYDIFNRAYEGLEETYKQITEFHNQFSN